MSRITEQVTIQRMLQRLNDNRITVDRHAQEVATGLKVVQPGDSNVSGIISNLNGVLERVEGATRTANSVNSVLQAQDDVLGQAAEILVRAKELATQGANGTLSQSERDSIAAEVFEIREHMIGLANTKYQGSYLFHGARTDIPPYSQATNYVEPPAGLGTTRYVYETASGGSAMQNQVPIGDNLTVTINTPGNQIFDNAIQGLERLGRSLLGYDTLPAHPTAP
ncbi:MAG: hypothetical protein KDD42_08200, partial [Bdellovibrionales bacterium]|nr:hypothetical protein [Bdellovibrionales bacterium]